MHVKPFINKVLSYQTFHSDLEYFYDFPLDKETPVFIHSFHGFVLSVKSWYFSGYVNEVQTAHDNPTYKNQFFQGYW